MRIICSFHWLMLNMNCGDNYTMLRTHIIEKKNPQHNQTWEWDETPELLAAIEQLKKSSAAVEAVQFKRR